MQIVLVFLLSSTANLQKMNSRALEEAVSTVTSYKAGVKAVVEENVGQCVSKLGQQESLSVESKESLQRILVNNSSASHCFHFIGSPRHTHCTNDWSR